MATSPIVDAPEPSGPLSPLAWVGGAALGVLERFGAMALLIPEAVGSVFRRDVDDEWSLRASTAAELSWILIAGFPLVGLVHVAMGSFLSLQAYYGSTFVDGTGAVVGVGLLRNLASLMAGMTLAGYLPVRMILEIRAARRPRAEGDDAEPAPSPGQLAASRLLAAMIATPLLSLWGFTVGTAVGWRASETLMSLPTSTFFMMFMRMIWFRDVVGLMIKGASFGLAVAVIACAEGLRLDASGSTSEGDELASAFPAMLRASCLAMMAILLINMTWFVLIYHAVPVYGPSLLQPPTP